MDRTTHVFVLGAHRREVSLITWRTIRIFSSFAANLDSSLFITHPGWCKHTDITYVVVVVNHGSLEHGSHTNFIQMVVDILNINLYDLYFWPKIQFEC